MPIDDLAPDVLTELGRVTWAAIELEDYTESLCAFIAPSNPREDRRLIGQKIKDATKVLATWSASSTRDDARAWLERAHEAIERRNAALHATPVVWINPNLHYEAPQLVLGEMPRKGRPYIERPLTVESLTELRSILVDASHGWRELVIAVGVEWKRQSHQPN